MSGNWHCPATPCIVVLYVYGAEDRKTKYNVQVRSGSTRVTSVCVLTRYGNRAMMPSARRSLPDRHHLCPPSAAWRPLTIASPRTIPSRDAANSVSVLYFRVPYHSSSPSRRLTTRPHYLLILISRTFSVLWSFLSLSRSLYRTELRPKLCRPMPLASHPRHLRRDLLFSSTARSYSKVCAI